MKLIETHSQPNLRCNKVDSPVFSSQLGSPAPDRLSDESFIQMENMVSKLCVSQRNSDTLELNNTLEVIDYILNHGPNNNLHEKPDPVKKQDTNDKASLQVCSPIKISPKKNTPVKETVKITEKTDKASPSHNTPAKSVMKKPLTEFVTPSSSSVTSKTPIFKTPAYPSTLKKPSTPRMTPGRTNAYQHITSPIASYIKNCPQSPLVKDVHPKKPLPGGSHIPKFVRNPSHGKIQLNKNKENINLPSVAYKNAKKTKVVSKVYILKLSTLTIIFRPLGT